jgi:hypothetical protein
VYHTFERVPTDVPRPCLFPLVQFAEASGGPGASPPCADATAGSASASAADNDTNHANRGPITAP